jgi:hypothetical protein
LQTGKTMTTIRNILGLIAGIILILSSGAHSILGWKGLSAKLAAINVPEDLVFGVKAGWEFGGIAMLAFGIIVVVIFVNKLRGRYASTFPAMVFAITYLAIGAWALSASNFNPFFWLFIVTGLLLLVAAWPASNSLPGSRGDSDTSEYIH